MKLFIYQSGKIILFYSEEDDINLAQKIILRKGDNFHVPIGLRHRMYAFRRHRIT